MNANSSIKETDTVTCNNCGSPGREVVFRAGVAQMHQVVRCEACGLMYAHPLTRSNVAQYSIEEDRQAPLTDNSPQVKHTADKMPDYVKILPKLAAMLPQKGRLVEIGSYSGVLTDALRNAGWDTIGIEPDGRAVEYARRKFGVNVVHGTLEDAALEPHSADAAVMLHVVEHIENPKSALRKVRETLRDGAIFVIETPAYDSVPFKLLGRRERSLSCDGHIYFYTKETLTDLLDQCGFDIVRSERVGRHMSLARLLWNVGIMSKSKALQDRLARLSERLGLDTKYLTLNLGDMIRMYARARPA